MTKSGCERGERLNAETVELVKAWGPIVNAALTVTSALIICYWTYRNTRFMGNELERLRMRERCINERLKTLLELKNDHSQIAALRDAVFMEGSIDEPGPRKAYWEEAVQYYNVQYQHYGRAKHIFPKQVQDDFNALFDQADMKAAASHGLNWYRPDSLDTLNAYREAILSVRSMLFTALDRQIEHENAELKKLIEGG